MTAGGHIEGSEAETRDRAHEEPAPPLVLVGEIAAAHGLQGEMRLNPLMDTPAVLARLPGVQFRYRDGRQERRRITSAKTHKRQLIVTVAGVADRETAEALRGVQIYIRRDQLPDLGPDTYYTHDLLGLTVVTEAGADLGAIQEVHLGPGGANDVYETPLAMIPAIGEVVLSVDLDARRMTVRDIPGLRKAE